MTMRTIDLRHTGRGNTLQMYSEMINDNFTEHDDIIGGAYGAFGEMLAVKSLSEILTVAAAATSTTVIEKPANSIILAVTARVTKALPIDTDFTVGDAGDAARFSTAAVAKALGSTDPGTKAGAYFNATAGGIVVTPDSTPTDATGRILITIFYIEVTHQTWTPVTVTPSTLALSLEEFAPTVTAGSLLIVTPTTLALVTETFAPSVTQNYTATPTTLALVLTTFEPTVSAS